MTPKADARACRITRVTTYVVGMRWRNCVFALVETDEVGSSRVDLQACKLEYSIVSPK